MEEKGFSSSSDGQGSIAPVEAVFRSHYSNLQLAAKVWGSSDAKLKVLALHGWMDNANTWDHLLPLLFHPASSDSVSKENVLVPPMQVVCLDLVGHGRSQHRPDRALYPLIDHIPDIMSVVDDELKWDKFCLLGHSMGEALSTIIAGLFPERVSAAILVEGIGPWLRSTEEWVSSFRKAMQTNRVLFEKEGPNVYPSFEAAVARLASNLPGTKQSSVETLVRRSTTQVEGGVQFTHDIKLRCAAHLSLSEEHFFQIMGHMRAPLLVVWGKDGILNDENNLMTKAVKQRAEYLRFKKLLVEEVTIDGSHHPHLDNAEEMAPIFGS
ncbi:Alpha/beta fold hydrolase [Balamuthia mandrillaris]